jgi:hypothetical protein
METMKLVKIVDSCGNDCGSNWHYRDGDLWPSTDAYYDFVIGEEMSEDGIALENDIVKNLANRSDGFVNGYHWSVIAVETAIV